MFKLKVIGLTLFNKITVVLYLFLKINKENEYVFYYWIKKGNF